MQVRAGRVCEPVLLRVAYPRPPREGGEEEEEEEEKEEGEIEIGRSKDSTLGELRVRMSYIVKFL